MTKIDFLRGLRFKTNETSPYTYAYLDNCIIEFLHTKNIRVAEVVGMNSECATCHINGITKRHVEVLCFDKLYTINNN